MYLQYGNYRHASGEASVVIAKHGLFSPGGIARGVRERWDIHGRLQAADQASLSTALGALMSAYSNHGLDIGFFFDNGQPTSHTIQSSATFGGVRVITPPSFPEGKGAEYSTYRNYSLAVEAEILDPRAAILSWTETLNFRGGGPKFAFLEPINGLPQKQLVKQFTTFRATQSGEASGLTAYPSPAPPLWPLAEHVDRREIHYMLPKRSGLPGNPSYTEFKVKWTYSFEDASPLFGLPTIWPV